MKRWWSRLTGDTLFKRMFLLMWVALVASHLLAFNVAMRVDAPAGAAPPMPRVVPALPPLGGPGPMGEPGRPMEADGPIDRDGPGGFGAPHGPRPDGHGPRPLSASALWLDYLVRFVAIGIAAWFGARWLSAPIRELARASETLSRALGEGRPMPVLDETRGTEEVRQTAQVFNAMAQRLRAQFDAQSLLMASISHDLRTPLARLRMRLETMDEQVQTQRCIADVRVLDALIDSVLDTVRDAHTRREPERIDAGALVQALVDDLVEQGQPASVTSAAPDAVVLARPAALTRALGNLIGNALRYGHAARVAVLADAHAVRIHVDDDGPGIPADRLEAVFEPFYRLDTSRSRETGGSGLGLYIARDLAQRNGGRLALANRPEGGLRATLELPRA